MLKDILDSCPAGLLPDAHLAGHSHNYQRYRRTINGTVIPYIVAGCGGHASTPLDPVAAPAEADLTYDVAFPVKGQPQSGYGYLKITASQSSLKIEFFALDDRATAFDSYEISIN